MSVIDAEINLLVEYAGWFRENITDELMETMTDEEIIQQFLEER